MKPKGKGDSLFILLDFYQFFHYFFDPKIMTSIVIIFI